MTHKAAFILRTSVAMLLDFHARPSTIFIVVIITAITVIAIAATPQTSAAPQTLQQKGARSQNFPKPLCFLNRRFLQGEAQPR